MAGAAARPADGRAQLRRALRLLVDSQSLSQHNKRIARLLSEAKPRLPQACVEDVDFPRSREPDKPLWRQLSTCRFIEDQRGILVVGATGTGKTYVSCALGQAALRKGHRVRYYRTCRLLDELALARADGSYYKLLCRLARFDLQILDDFLMSPPTEMQRRICWKSWRTATAIAPRSAAVSFLSTPGTLSSEIQRSPMRCSTAWSTTPIASC